jgi:hypothetical protein
MNFDTPERRYSAAFTAGRFARECIRTARCTMRWSTADFRRGNFERADGLKREAFGERAVFRAMIRQGRSDRGFLEGYRDNSRTDPDTAATVALGDVIAFPYEDARAGRWRAVREDMAARGGFALDDPDNRP